MELLVVRSACAAFGLGCITAGPAQFTRPVI